MKSKKLKVCLYIVLFVFLLVVISMLYNKLSAEYVPEQETPVIDDIDKNPAPDFTVYDKNRAEISLSDFEGTPVVINFWATWCGPCKMELPAFENAYHKYKDNVEFLMINVDDGSSEKVENFLSREGYSFPAYYDNSYQASVSYSVTSIPTTVFIDEEGNIVHKRIGSMSEDMLVEYIEILIGE